MAERKKIALDPRAALEKCAASATLRHVRISPRKIRPMLNMIRGKQVEPALNILRFAPQKSAGIVHGVLASAVANAREAGGIDVDNLWVTGGWVNPGKTMGRIMAGAQGRATSIKKRSSHVTVVLNER